MEFYDVLVIGTGVAATTAAVRCRGAGRRVAIVDHRPFGGTCALRGCDPKKVLVAAAEAVDAVHRMAGVEVVAGEIAVDWAALQRFKRRFTDPVPAQREHSFAAQGIDAYHGTARFTGPRRLRVDGREMEAAKLIVACGAEPAPLPVKGSEYLTTSDAFLELERLPRRIVFVGGGYIGFEFAHVAARAGAAVTILNRGPRPLRRFDPYCVDALAAHTTALGVRLLNGHALQAVERRGAELLIHARHADGGVTVAADMVVHGAGRVPAVADLDLEAAGITHEQRRICVNPYLQSVSNPAVYVAGDAVGGALPLTPVAELEGGTAAANVVHGNHTTVDYTGIPTAVFTTPALARVGMLEEEVQSQGLRSRSLQRDAGDWYTARRLNEPCYRFKVLVEEGSDRVLGAHIVGPEAAATINLFALALRGGLDARALKEAVFTYPSGASDLPYMLP